ncbi:MAG: caspase family protein [Cellvibrionaceae bacterium]|nr:caspase family protein [Cellvibrionaceae bacterium]
MQRLKPNTLFCIAAITLSPLLAADDYYNDTIDVVANERSDALYQAVLEVTQKSFSHLLGKEHWNKALDECLAIWISPQATANDYKPLVEDYHFTVDETIGNSHALQGNLLINMNYIAFLWDRHQQHPQCELTLPPSQSAYIEPIDPSDGAPSQLLQAVRESLKQQLLDEHFLLVDKQHRHTALIRIQLHSARTDSHHKVKSLSVRGDYKDNRVDKRLEIALNADVSANLVTTEGALDAELYRSAAQLMLRQIREHSIQAQSQRTQIDYILQSAVSLDQQDLLVQRVAEQFSLPETYKETPNIIQLTAHNDGHYQLTLVIPARYGFSLTRSQIKRLRHIGEAIFQEKIISQQVTVDKDTLRFSSLPAIQAANKQQLPPPQAQPTKNTAAIVLPALEAYRGLGVQPAEKLLGLAASTQGIYSIKVNGRPVVSYPATAEQARLLRLQGASTQVFEIDRASIQHPQSITVTITDQAGKITQKQWLSTGDSWRAATTADQSALLAQGALALNAKLHVLLIANQDYKHWRKLTTPYKDVDQLQQLLIHRYRVQTEHITLLKDATQHQMAVALDRLNTSVGINDSVIIYYAGHGHLDQRSGRDGYWIPVDGKAYNAADRRTSWLANAAIADTLEHLKARHVLLISDSCYAGTFATRGKAAGDFIATVNYIKGLAGKRSRLALTSGNVEPVNDLGPDGHSIFAYHLLQSLRNNRSPFFTASELFHSLHSPVKHAARQQPQHFAFSDSDEGGELIFVTKDAGGLLD